MLQPMDKPPASWAPRLAASMMPGPPPVMTREAALREQKAQSSGGLVHGIRRPGARRAEDGNGGADFGKGIEGVDEFALNAQDAARDRRG